VRQVTFDGFTGDAACTLTAVKSGQGGGPGGGGRGRGAAPQAAPAPPLSTLSKAQVARCEPTLTIPADARITEPYWHRAGEAGRYVFDPDAPFGQPYRPTPFYVQASLAFAGSPEEVFGGLPVQYRYEGNIFSGEKRSGLLVVPALSMRVAPEVSVLPAAAVKAGREVRVSVVNDSNGAVETSVALNVPSGWTVVPAEQRVAFAREDQAQTIRFQVRPPATTAPGEYRVSAQAAVGSQTFSRGFQVIEYPHITRQHIFHDAATRLKVIDVRTSPNLTVGYIMGVGDEVPQAITQLGARVEFLDADDLAWGDLSRFPTIVAGVRAYERRADLRANNSRLLDYVRSGGRFVVQYNKFEFNEAQYGPHPAKVTSDRVTDENAPVRILTPADPVFTAPNKIADAAWRNWVQERGLYFLSDHDSRYRDLVELEDPFPNNPGVKRGALVAATYGKGRWVYVGLALWRELPAGVDGAYQLLANLISH
jgi:hypothetical protein